MGKMAEAGGVSRLVAGVLVRDVQRTDLGGRAQRDEDRRRSHRARRAHHPVRHESREVVKQKQRILLYYTAFAVTLNSIMLLGYIEGWWN